MSRDDIIRAIELRSAADRIADRFMPPCPNPDCDECDPARFAVQDTVRRICADLIAKSDRLDPDRTDPWDVPK